MKILEVKNLGFTYENYEKPVLNGVSFSLQAGEVLGISGSNGSGKTTLCYCLCGIIPHCLSGKMDGKVFINGTDSGQVSLHQLTSDVGIVLQDPGIQILMPTVEDEIAFGLENQRVPREKMKEIVNETLDLVGITPLRGENPNNLSGGQKQLAALASVLALNPSLLIFDESLSMLDEMASQRILFVMKKLKDRGKTLVIVDHTSRGRGLYDKIFLLGRAKLTGTNKMTKENEITLSPG